MIGLEIAVLLIFFIGFIMKIYERWKFEKNKQNEEAKYISLFRKHNTTMIVVYVALVIIYIERILNRIEI